MLQFCCTGDCANSANRKDLSVVSFPLPLNSRCLLSVWIVKMKRDHDISTSFPNTLANSLHQVILLIHTIVKIDWRPTQLPFCSRNKDKHEKVQPLKKSAVEKLNRRRPEKEEATDTASDEEFDTLVSIRSSKDWTNYFLKDTTY